MANGEYSAPEQDLGARLGHRPLVPKMNRWADEATAVKEARPTITGALDDVEKMTEMLRQGIDSLEARLQPLLGPGPIVDRGVTNSLGGALGAVPTTYSVRQQIANLGQRLWALQQQVNSLTARVEL